MENTIKKKKIIFSAICSSVLLAVTFATDRGIFTFPPRSDERYALAMADYCVCKILAFAVLIALFFLIGTLIFDRGEGRDALLGVIKCACLYLPVIVICLVIKLPAGFLTNDEYSIYNDSTNLIHDTWFNYMTVYYYTVSLMLIPFRYGPIIMKTVIEFFVAGYTVYRSKLYFGKRAGMFMYVLFLMYPVIAYTTSAHRLPVYFLIYLAMFVKLTFDRLEKKDLSAAGAAFMLIAGAVLTQWRTEGIYLVVLLPILMFLAYPNIRNKKSVAAVLVSYMLIQYVISIPQNGIGSENLSGAANDRMKPFYAYTITNMYRNGLDPVKNADDLAIIDRYIPIESIESINEYYEDINYEDVLILYKEEFGGVRENAGYTEYYDFTQAVKRIFANNPDVFVRTRWGAFKYAALPYHIEGSGGGISGMIKTALSIVKTISYNLFIPTVFAALLCIVSLIRRKWYMFFVGGGLCAHWFIVFVLAPASYFKYYFPVYIMEYFYIIALMIWFFASRSSRACPLD